MAKIFVVTNWPFSLVYCTFVMHFHVQATLLLLYCLLVLMGVFCKIPLSCHVKMLLQQSLKVPWNTQGELIHYGN